MTSPCHCRDGWICEAHPDRGWPHEACPGPGMPCDSPTCPVPRSGAKPALSWDVLIASVTDDAQRHVGDRELWRVTKPDRHIVCRVREIPTGDGYVALELRVEHNGQVFRTEVHKERVGFSQRVDELRQLLEAEGWTAEAHTRCKQSPDHHDE